MFTTFRMRKYKFHRKFLGFPSCICSSGWTSWHISDHENDTFHYLRKFISLFFTGHGHSWAVAVAEFCQVVESHRRRLSQHGVILNGINSFRFFPKVIASHYNYCAILCRNRPRFTALCILIWQTSCLLTTVNTRTRLSCKHIYGIFTERNNCV